MPKHFGGKLFFIQGHSLTIFAVMMQFGLFFEEGKFSGSLATFQFIFLQNAFWMGFVLIGSKAVKPTLQIMQQMADYFSAFLQLN